MIGITYLRKELGMSAEKFGREIGVSRPTISKWESGNQEISRKRLALMEGMFQCEAVLLEKEIDNDEMAKLTLTEAAYKYIHRTVYKEEPDDNFFYELEEARYKVKIDSIVKTLNEKKELIKYMERVREVYERTGGKEILNVLLAVGEKFQTGRFDNCLVVGNTDYKKGHIRKDDNLIEMIVQALKFGLSKGGDNNNEKSE
jgi:transcriptional regulator with XRE-family HTH domain